MRTSFHTGFLGNLPVLDAVAAVLDAGFDAVELNAETLPWAPPHVTPETPGPVRSRLARRGAVSSIAAHRPGLASTDATLRGEAVAWTLGCAELASDIGASIIHVIPGDAEVIPSGLPDESEPGDLGAFLDSLHEVAEGADRLGIQVGLEPIINQLVSTTDQAAAVLAQVDGLGISFDPSHLQVTTGDVTGAARRLGPRVLIAALKDAHGIPADFQFTPLGDGDIDFPAMIRALAEADFDGYLVVEHESHAFGDKRDAAAVLADGRAFADKLAQGPLPHAEA